MRWTVADLFEPTRHYYVSLRRESAKGVRTSLLAGPFDTHAEALAMVERASDEAYEVDPWTWFDQHGTCSLPRREGNPRGVLNERLGLTG